MDLPTLSARNTRLHARPIGLGIVWLWLLLAMSSMLPVQAHEEHVDPAPAALEAVTLQLKWLHQFQFAGYYAAVEKGFFAEEGLDVTLLERTPGSNLVEAVTSGQVDYAIGDSSLVAAYAAGAPIKLLAAIFQHDPLVFISRQDLGIMTPYELRGKRIMFDNAGGNDAVLRSMLAELQINEDDYTYVPHTFSNDDLLEGRVDVMSAYLTNEPFYFAQQGVEINQFNPRSLGLDFYGDILFTSQHEVLNNPERVARFRRAALKGWQYALDHPQELIKLTKQKYQSRHSLALLQYEAKTTRRLILPEQVPLGNIEPRRIDHIAQLLTGIDNLPMLNQTAINSLVYGTESSLQLTPAEQAWLDRNPVIRIGIDRTFAPFEWLDEDGNYLGMSADYMKLFEEKLGVAFEVVGDKTWQETLQLARDGKLHMLTDAVRTPEREQYLLFSKPYIQSPIVIMADASRGYVGDLENLHGKVVAIESGYFMQEVLRREHPQISLLTTDSELEALKLVTDGDAAAYIGDGVSLNYLIQKHGLINLRFAGETDYLSDHSLAVVAEHPELLSIMQKAIDSIPQQEKDAIANRWMGLRFEQGINPWQIAGYAGAALLLLVIVVYWNFRLQREVEARKASEGNLRQLLGASPIAVRIARTGGREVIFTNRGYEKLINIQPGKATGVDPKSYYVDPGDYEEVLAILARGESVSNRLVELKIPDQPNKWALATYFPFTYEGEEAVLGWFYDITEQRRADEARQAAVFEAQKARSAAEVAEQANQMKSQFLANMSHELRTPMHAIISFAQLAIKKSTDPKLDRYLDNIQASSRRLTRLLNDLLDLSKLEAGHMTMHFGQHRLSDLVSQCSRELHTLLEDKQLTLSISGDAELSGEFDFDRISQVLTNLLSNAIKFSPAEGSIEVIYELVQDGRLALTVTNHGDEIPPNELEAIFNKFIQSSKTRSNAGGTGLGLAISREIIHAHQGQIWAINLSSLDDDSHGARFILEIPLSQSAAGSELESEMGPESESESGSESGPASVTNQAGG